MEKFWKFIKEEDGLELSEYAVIGAIIIGVGAGVYLALSNAISDAITSITDTISTSGS